MNTIKRMELKIKYWQTQKKQYAPGTNDFAKCNAEIGKLSEQLAVARRRTIEDVKRDALSGGFGDR